MFLVKQRPLAVARASLVSCLAAGLMVAGPSFAAPPPPPAAPLTPVDTVLHGVKVPDPYRGLEDVKNPQTLSWLRAQGAYAANRLAAIEGRDALQARVTALSQATGDVVREVLRMPGDRLYFMRRKAGESQYKLVMRSGPDARETVLVDPGEQAKATGVPHAVNYFMPSWDGRTLAYGMSAGGSEDTSLYLLDIASGQAIGEPIPRVHGGLVHWSPDSRRLTYNQNRALPADAPDTEAYMDTTVFQLQVGQPASKARPVFGPLVDRGLKLDRLDVGEVIFDAKGRYMLARTTDTTTPEGKLFVAPVSDLDKPAVRWRKVSDAADKITDVQLRGDAVYLKTHAGAPRSKLLKLDLRKPDLRRAVVVVPEPARGVLAAFQLGRDAVYAEVLEGFNTRVLRYADGKPGSKAEGIDVAPEVQGSTYGVADPARSFSTAWVATSAWTSPRRILATDGKGGTQDTGLLKPVLPPDMPALSVKELTVPSHDGAPVPLAIVHKQGLALDGSNPTLLVGYGAYGFSIEAGFDPRTVAWLEKGGVLAYANVRGSGAYGDPWYRAGFKTTKPNTWKDGIACAQYLVAQGYASPKTLGIWGTSAGGIFVGRAVTTAPDLFAAAVFDVGMMDTIRSEESANGVTNISEFGTVKDPVEFAALLEMSTYHHIRDGVAYPGVLLIHGLNDPRVDVWESAKAAARLQAATSSGRPILLRLDEQAGHGIGSTAQQGASKLADLYSFLLWQFGKVGVQD